MKVSQLALLRRENENMARQAAKAQQQIARLAQQLESANRVMQTQTYPSLLTPGLGDILGQPCFTFIQLAQLWRKAGVDIPTCAEREQAYFIDKHLRIYMQHGDEWRKVFGEEVGAMVEKAQASIKPEVPHG